MRWENEHGQGLSAGRIRTNGLRPAVGPVRQTVARAPPAAVSDETFRVVARLKVVPNNHLMNYPQAGRFSRVLLMALVGAGALTAGVAARADRVSVGVSVGVPLPHGYAEVHYGRDRYYYHRGYYYRPGPHGYVVVRPPRGIIVRELPPRCSRVYVGSTVYYRYDNVYYQPVSGGYVVVDQPPTVVVSQPAPAAVVPATPAPPATAPEEYQSVWVGDVEYQFKDGQFFKKTADGLVWSPAPLGAITRTVPSDAQSVWYQDVEYFECDNVYFRKTPNGYQVVEAPWKKAQPAPEPAAPPPPGN
jgi:hypothetical protein